MLRPDPELLGLERKETYDEIIIEMMTHPEGDLFISDAMIEFHIKKDPTAVELDVYMELADDAHNHYNFAIIFQNAVRGCFWSCSDRLEEFDIDHESIQQELRTDFFLRNKYIIDWVWKRIKWYNIWHPIKFVGSIITHIISKKKSR